ncbi:ATP-binding cassette domain-containing protein [Epidermidibacterium keratini]|uniref:ATP-binding cassette domain-containing protein n=1 Tax=Epidermidibacterium keratini TaxID=1891644 RepID=A0A7L4YTU1_9ACTN|nr:ATP-binding cassette domain-containing protein [Epidermidibacterium keratini]
MSKSYDARPVLRELSLRIEDGEFVVILGPSGCGKSTLLQIVSGLSAPDSGQVLIDDVDVTDRDGRTRNVAMVFQNYALYPHLSAQRNIEFPLRAAKVARSERSRRAREIADPYGLLQHLDKKPAELSGGQQQRVALARATVREPAAFLMDEPLSNLDAALRASTRHYLRTLHTRLRATILYVTHDQVEAMSLATRVVLLRDGQVQQDCAPALLYDEPATTFAARFVGMLPMNLVQASLISTPSGIEAHARGVQLPLTLPAGDDLGARDVTVGFRPEALQLERPDCPKSGVHGTVTAVENLGHEQVAYVDIAGTPIAARLSRAVSLAAGDTARFTVRASDLHLFSTTTGRRLRWQTPSSAVAPTPALPSPVSIKEPA